MPCAACSTRWLTWGSARRATGPSNSPAICLVVASTSLQSTPLPPFTHTRHRLAGHDPMQTTRLLLQCNNCMLGTCCTAYGHPAEHSMNRSNHPRLGSSVGCGSVVTPFHESMMTDGALLLLCCSLSLPMQLNSSVAGGCAAAVFERMWFCQPDWSLYSDHSSA